MFNFSERKCALHKENKRTKAIMRNGMTFPNFCDPLHISTLECPVPTQTDWQTVMSMEDAWMIHSKISSF